MSSSELADRPETVFDQVGGMPFFANLAHAFYQRVGDDPGLRPLYPDDLGPGEDHLKLFLAQYWGGPTTYSDTRGHPRLRMRHAPFFIGEAEAGHWLANMVGAIDDVGTPDDVRVVMIDYFTMAATHLINQA